MNKHSWITLSQSDPRALYLQVIEQIQRRVAVGNLPPGTELPSIRQLAADLSVSVITIKRAYLELERDGTITTRQGKGSIVSDASRILDQFATSFRVRDLESRHCDVEVERATGACEGLTYER